MHFTLDDGVPVKAFQELLHECPEHSLPPRPRGPTQPVVRDIEGIAGYFTGNIGKIFVINQQPLEKVRHRFRTLVDISKSKQLALTRYLALSSLTWSQSTKARIANQKDRLDQLPRLCSTLFTPVDWNTTARDLFSSNRSVNQ